MKIIDIGQALYNNMNKAGVPWNDPAADALRWGLYSMTVASTRASE